MSAKSTKLVTQFQTLVKYMHAIARVVVDGQRNDHKGQRQNVAPA